MVGYPTETEQDYLETELLLKRYAHLNSDHMILLGITPTFQLLHNSPLLQSPELVKEYGLSYNINNNLSRYFWTADINPENIFPVRYDRFMRLITLAKELNYTFQREMALEKYLDELAQLKHLYNEYKPKKMFHISTSK
jgi:hypothetical protein